MYKSSITTTTTNTPLTMMTRHRLGGDAEDMSHRGVNSRKQYRKLTALYSHYILNQLLNFFLFQKVQTKLTPPPMRTATANEDGPHRAYAFAWPQPTPSPAVHHSHVQQL